MDIVEVVKKTSRASRAKPKVEIEVPITVEEPIPEVKPKVSRAKSAKPRVELPLKVVVAPKQSMSPEEIDIARKHLRQVLHKNIKPIIDRTETIESRVQFAKIIRNYLKNIQTCIHSSVDKPNHMALSEKKDKIIKEKVFFDKQIGSESIFGTAYMNAGKGLGRLLKFSEKIMPISFKNEIDILDKMSKLVEKGISPNMPLVYTSVKCNKPKDSTLATNPAANDRIRKGNYYVVLSEIADGDTQNFFQSKYSDNVYESALTQIMFSLRAFHNMGYYHDDVHLGNFLWHKITPGGYWQYQYNDTTIYVPNTGHLLVLWDPGNAKPLPNATIYKDMPLFRDYIYAYSLIDEIETRDTFKKLNMIPVPEHIRKPFVDITKKITIDDLYLSYNMMIDELILLLKTNQLKHIYYKTNTQNTLPPNSIIINKIAYVL
jgi:hypothetical protein